jgi:hypothetical protein
LNIHPSGIVEVTIAAAPVVAGMLRPAIVGNTSRARRPVRIPEASV